METFENPSDTVSDIKLREEFVQDLNGTYKGEVVLFCIQVPLFTFITIFLELCILNRININVYKLNTMNIKWYHATVVFIVEAIAIVVPIVFMLTLLSDYVHLIFLFAVTIILIIIIHSVSSPDEHVHYWKLPHFKGRTLSENLPGLLGKQPFITYFRSLVLLVTTISILGVDFHIYPRRFAKTETYGVSLMDLGVGLFVFSNAIVVKRNIALSHGFYRTLLETSVFLLLGAVRYLLVQRFDYQRHVTEYGVHWNFFITLGFMKLLSYFLLIVSRGYSFICGFALMLMHQYFLSSSLESQVLNNKQRDDWFNANREGIVSLCGYLSLYLMGVGLATIVNPKDKPVTLKNKMKTLILLVIVSSFFLFISCYIDNTLLKISRRLANLPFILWITAVSLAILAITLTVELLSICFLPIQPRFKSKEYFLITPSLLESINYNGLLFFLISNLLTGLVNLNFDVYSLKPLSSMIILVSYMLLNCVVVFTLYLLNIQVKFW